MKVSLVIETFNLGGDAAIVTRAIRALLAKIERPFEVIATHVGLPIELRETIDVTWVEVAPEAGYYTHKTAGFAATSGDIVAFLDGDCAPVRGWLAALTAPFADGARVVAGSTSYPGELATVANHMDFPQFARGAGHVRNFFANNVAFSREVFAEHPYPSAPMFHGQCQILAMRLAEAGIAIRHAPDARVYHAWPASIGEWLETRLLRGADTRSLLPYVAGTYVPPAAPIVARLGALPALALFGARALRGVYDALGRGPKALALVAGVTLVDAVGALAGPRVYRAFA